MIEWEATEDNRLILFNNEFQWSINAIQAQELCNYINLNMKTPLQSIVRKDLVITAEKDGITVQHKSGREHISIGDLERLLECIRMKNE